jgi:hypothetical protein
MVEEHRNGLIVGRFVLAENTGRMRIGVFSHPLKLMLLDLKLQKIDGLHCFAASASITAICCRTRFWVRAS